MRAFFPALQANLNGLLTGALYALLGMGTGQVISWVEIMWFRRSRFVTILP